MHFIEEVVIIIQVVSEIICPGICIQVDMDTGHFQLNYKQLPL